MGGDAGDPGGPAALCKLSMEWVCQVGGKNKLQLILNKASRYGFYARRLSVERNSYGDVAGWLGGWVARCHTPVLYQNR